MTFISYLEAEHLAPAAKNTSRSNSSTRRGSSGTIGSLERLYALYAERNSATRGNVSLGSGQTLYGRLSRNPLGTGYA